jgi:multidrug efflux system membrane fusion protein
MDSAPLDLTATHKETRRQTGSKLRWLVALAALVGVAAIAFYAIKVRGDGSPAPGAPAGPAASAGDRVVPVTTAVVVRRDVPVTVEGLGNVVPLMTVTVRPQVDGRLDRVFFKEGDPVKKGDVLAQIDARPFSIQLHQGEAALARDRANLANAQRTLERYTKLSQDTLVTEQQVDDQRATAAQLEAVTQADQATIEAARLNLEYARITSPIDGVTGVRLVDPGNIVKAADTTGIVVVTQLDPIAIIFTLPQDDLPRVQRGMSKNKLIVDALARDGGQNLGSGTLELIDNQVNTQTATVRLKAHFANAARTFWPSQFVKARLHLETEKDMIVVPAAAIQRGPKGTFVYVVAPDKTTNPKTVEVASIEGDDAIVQKGLAAGEIVVTEGQNQLKPGAKVAPRGDAPSAGSAAPPKDGPREVERAK